MLESMLRKALIGMTFAAFLLPAAAGAASPGAVSTTGAADQITDTSARVEVYVHEVADRCWIDYGTTLSYGSQKDLPCGGTSRATLTGLTPGSTYYYQLGVSTPDGTGHSPTYKSFTTLGTAPPNGSPSPPPSRQAALAVTKAQRVATVARKGVRLRFTLPSTCPCTVSAQLRVSKQTAKRLHLRNRRLGSVQRKGLLGKATVTVKLKSAAARRLRHNRRAVSVEALASVADGQGHTSALNGKLTLRR